MASDLASLANPLMFEIGPATPRIPEPMIDLDLPEGTIITSADGHWWMVSRASARPAMLTSSIERRASRSR